MSHILLAGMTMTSEISDFERKIVNLIEKELTKRSEKFQKAQLQVQVNPPKRTHSPSGLNSEIEILFLRSGDLVDILEFHIYLAGRQSAAENEIATWLQENLDSILSAVEKS